MTDPAAIRRRDFLRALGLGGIGAGVLACSSRPARDAVPYAVEPPELVPGRPQHYATALVEDGYAIGVVAEAHEGRPTKLDGNPDHPASLGGTRAKEQAALFGLYDDTRAQGTTEQGAAVPWGRIARVLRAATELVVIAEPNAIGREQLARLRARPRTRVAEWSRFGASASIAGNAIAFGRPLQTQLDLREADVIVALDADLVGEHPMGAAYARRIADRRRVRDARSPMSRIYAVESGYSQLGAIADHRFAARPSAIARAAAALLAGSGDGWVRAIGRDLARAGGGGVVVAGETQPPLVHAIAAAINARLGSRAVSYTEPVAAHDALPDLRETDALLVIGEVAPPVRVPAATSVWLGLHAPPKSYRFGVAALHALESWGSAPAYDGTPTPIQPLIEPLVDGRSADAVIAAVLGEAPTAGRPAAFDDAVLARGTLGPAAARVEVGAVREFAVAGLPAEAPYELVTRPHPYLHDGRYASNPWLRELPDPVTKVTWDATAQLAPATAARLGVESGDVLALGDGVHLPVAVAPGIADGVVIAHLPMSGTPKATGDHVDLAFTQLEGDQHGRAIARAVELRAIVKLPAVAAPPSLFAERDRAPGPQWAMSIDLTSCTGCSACVMACAVENNTPVVGKAHVAEGRAMHWLRIDRYVDDGGEARLVPMACQHCELAPCEYVCPVGATTHSPDGLNEMTYNRCVGTRFCSNNCPYKVRRFNWFDFREKRGLHVLGKNPDVTVRARGVMEKCTYCVQRIRRAEIDARLAGAARFEVVTACQQACPTGAIAFGSLTDPASHVVEQRARPHAYAVLEDQGTRPRTQYLAQVRNRNPEIA